VFRQGDDAINWYALLDGSVDVRVAQAPSSPVQCNGADQQQLQKVSLVAGGPTLGDF
jgi:hypothetical protein